MGCECPSLFLTHRFDQCPEGLPNPLEKSPSLGEPGAHFEPVYSVYRPYGHKGRIAIIFPRTVVYTAFEIRIFSARQSALVSDSSKSESDRTMKTLYALLRSNFVKFYAEIGLIYISFRMSKTSPQNAATQRHKKNSKIAIPALLKHQLSLLTAKRICTQPFH